MLSESLKKLATQLKFCLMDAHADDKRPVERPRGLGVGSIWTPADNGRRPEEVKNWKNLADVFFEWPWPLIKLYTLFRQLYIY